MLNIPLGMDSRLRSPNSSISLNAPIAILPS
jgi:hypothetical protein